MTDSNISNLDGQTFGRLTIIKRVENDKWKHIRWLCRCVCGKQTVVYASNLKNGHAKSCGCLRKELLTQHGHSCRNKTTKTYKTWQHMIQRCNNSNNKRYANYGGRGIKVCKK